MTSMTLQILIFPLPCSPIDPSRCYGVSCRVLEMSVVCLFSDIIKLDGTLSTSLQLQCLNKKCWAKITLEWCGCSPKPLGNHSTTYVRAKSANVLF